MITKNSIDLKSTYDNCYAESLKGTCKILISKSKHCRTHRCPFYKPQGAKEWIRVEDKKGVYLVPPEEYGNVSRDK